MASKAAISKNNKRKRLVKVHQERRQELRTAVRDTTLPQEERALAMRTLNKLPRNSSRVRVRNRCILTGRPRAYYRKFGLSRLALRDLALSGELPGVTKSSW